MGYSAAVRNVRSHSGKQNSQGILDRLNILLIVNIDTYLDIYIINIDRSGPGPGQPQPRLKS